MIVSNSYGIPYRETKLVFLTSNKTCDELLLLDRKADAALQASIVEHYECREDVNRWRGGPQGTRQSFAGICAEGPRFLVYEGCTKRVRGMNSMNVVSHRKRKTSF
jgi:hypothetical protein